MYTPSRNLCEHPCPAEGCTALLKSWTAFSKHIRQYHPEINAYTCMYYSQPHSSLYNLFYTPQGIDYESDINYLSDIKSSDDLESEGTTTGPSSKTFHKYLTAIPCDKNGNTLHRNERETPPPRHERLPDDWAPFGSKLEFDVAEFVYCKTKMSRSNANILMKLFASLRGGDPIFTDYDDLCETIDSTNLGDVPWQCSKLQYTGNLPLNDIPEWMTAQYDIYYRDPNEVIKNILSNTAYNGAFNYVPYQEYDNGVRRYENLMSGDWAFKQATLLAENLENHGAMFVPIILGSDKTTVSVATGHTEFWPLYFSIGNVHNKVRRAHDGALVLIGFLSIPKTDQQHANSKQFRSFRRQMFHASLVEILSALKPGMLRAEVVRCPDGHFRRAIYGLGPYIADYPEQVLISCIVQNWCPKCTAHRLHLDEDLSRVRRTPKHTKTLVTHFELIHVWDEYGIVGDAIPFTEEFPRADIYELITPDLLHQIIKGTFKDHLVTWVGKYLVNTHGEDGANIILADIDRRIAVVPPFSDLRRFPQGRGFKQWTGADSKALMKVYLPAIKGYVPDRMLRCFRAFLEFCYIVRHDVITEKTLDALKEALSRFYHYRLVFRELGISTGLSLPRQHAMMHYFDMIRLFGAPNGICSSITESKHKRAVKEPWRRTNHYQPLHQMLVINQRLDKLAAMRTDFTERGMIEPSGLRAALDLIGYKTQISELAAHIDDFQLPELFRRFLYDLKYPGSPIVSIHACPQFDDKISVTSSASTVYFAPSDPARMSGFRKDRIYATPSWRNHVARYDTVLVKNGFGPGPKGLSVARLYLLFSFEFEGVKHPAALVQWFTFVNGSPDEDVGMWIVERTTRADGSPLVGFILTKTILQSCHLIPVYGTTKIPLKISWKNSLVTFKTYYLNRYIDHHAFEILS
ncbi:hypothetical protein JOM56_009426 [Amanita muscaria]